MRLDPFAAASGAGNSNNLSQDERSDIRVLACRFAHPDVASLTRATCCGFGAVLCGAVWRGLAAFAATRLAAVFFTSFAALMDVFLAIAFTRRCRRDSPAD
jgi:hypothetical protein